MKTRNQRRKTLQDNLFRERDEARNELERVRRERDDLRRDVEELRRAEAMRWPGGIGR